MRSRATLLEIAAVASLANKAAYRRLNQY